VSSFRIPGTFECKSKKRESPFFPSPAKVFGLKAALCFRAHKKRERSSLWQNLELLHYRSSLSPLSDRSFFPAPSAQDLRILSPPIVRFASLPSSPRLLSHPIRDPLERTAFPPGHFPSGKTHFLPSSSDGDGESIPRHVPTLISSERIALIEGDNDSRNS